MYGVPPEESKFKKGESGNPNGRPLGVRNRSTIVREILEVMENTKNPITGKIEELTQEQIMTLSVLMKAKKGDTRAYQALMDSGYGAPKNQVETTGDTVIRVVHEEKPKSEDNG